MSVRDAIRKLFRGQSSGQTSSSVGDAPSQAPAQTVNLKVGFRIEDFDKLRDCMKTMEANGPQCMVMLATMFYVVAINQQLSPETQHGLMRAGGEAAKCLMGLPSEAMAVPIGSVGDGGDGTN